MRARRFSTSLACVVTGTALAFSGVGAANAATGQVPATGSRQAAPAAVTAPGAATVPTTGTFTDAAGKTGRFTGDFTISKFTDVGNAPAAVGTLTGTLTDSAGTSLGSVDKQVTEAIAIPQATCSILHLTLGPLDLNLLGLLVHLNQVVLNIDASQAPGNLLGNLLCAIAHLLDPAHLPGLLSILNQILAAL